MIPAGEVRTLTGAEVHLALDWAADEGWNPGHSDAASFYAADPGGFLVALDQGEPAAVASLVRYGATFAFLGLYICRPDRRGRGFGMRVWNEAMAVAGDRTIGLDGVIAQQANYARSGFTLAWQNARYRGVGGGTVPAGLVDLDTVPFSEIADYDGTMFEAERHRFLRLWVAQPDAVRLGVMRGGRLAGWGLMRPCLEGYKIGPLMADDAEAGELLLTGLLAAIPGEPVFLDVPEPNLAAVQAAVSRGMEPVFSTARMYRGTPKLPDVTRLWGVTSFELG